MTNYFNFPLDTWEKYAQEVCFSIDQKVKSNAQQFFYHFIQNPNINIITDLMKNGSDTLLFALFSYIGKYPQVLVKDCYAYLYIMREISGWQLNEFNFIRNSNERFAPYVTKTIMSSVGILMKYLYQNEETSQKLIQFLRQMPLNFFKVYVLKMFIQIVQVVDVQMGYMRFRTMVYHFQDNIIPMICDTLMPFFHNFQDGLRMNDLTASLQSKLQVNQQTAESRSQQIQMTKQQEMQSQYILMLLKKIVQFNYNITYTQYQSQQVIDTCLITFPQRVADKIITSQFLNALFFVVTKVMESKSGNKKNQFLNIVLQCLAKIMQARLGYVCNQSKEKFVCSAIKGLFHLLKVCQQLQSQVLLEGILTCNKKLLLSVELSYIKQVVQKDQQSKEQDLYNNYMRELTWMIQQIVKRSTINTQNTILNQSMQVISKMMVHVSDKQEESMQPNSSFLIQFLKEFVLNFVVNLTQGKNIFPTQRIIWLSQNKQAVDQIFDHFKKISSYVYQDLFRAVDHALDNYAQNNKHDLTCLANLLFIIGQLVDRHFFQRNVNMNRATCQELYILARILQKASLIVQQYSTNRQNYLNIPGSNYLDIAVLIFCQSILIEFLNNFQSTISLKIKHKLYLVSIFGPAYNQDLDYQEHQSQNTIIHYLNIVFKFFNFQSMGNDADVKMLHALQIVERVTFKLKWNMKRQTFLKSKIFKLLLGCFDDYSMRFYPLPQIMVKVGKITVSLNFDDIMDEYKFRINKFIQKLPKSQGFGTIFYYMIGIFQGMEPANILRCFWQKLKRHMNMQNFFKQIFIMAVSANTDKTYKDVCRLCRFMTLNKGLRSQSNGYIAAQIYQFVLPQLIWFINNITNAHQLDLDLLGEAIQEIIEMFNGIINGTSMNMYVLDICKASGIEGLLGQSYVYQYLKMLVSLTKHMNLYPKIEDSLLTSFVAITKQILEFIFDGEGKLAQMFSHFVIKMIDLLIIYIKAQLNGNRLIQDKLIKVIDGLRIFNRYIHRKQKIIHKQKLQSNVKAYGQIVLYYPQSQNPQNKIDSQIFYLLNLLLVNHKNNSTYLRPIYKYIYELNKKYTNIILQNIAKMNIVGEKMIAVHKILEENRQGCQQSFVDELKNWVKQFDAYK